MNGTTITTATTTTTTTTSSTTAGKWSDIPKRLTTISIGIPIVWSIWYNTITRIIFFHGLHFVLIIEWIRIVTTNTRNQPTTNTTKNSKKDDDNNNNNNNNTNLLSSSTSSELVLWVYVPIISVILFNIPNDVYFITVATFHIGISSVLLQHSTPVIIVAMMQALFLITIPMRIWLEVTSHPTQGFIRTVTLLLTTWNCDTGALLAGRYFRTNTQISNTTTQEDPIRPFRTWLARISPNKSIEGLFGGIGLGVFTYVCIPWFWKFIAQWPPLFVPVDNEIQFITPSSFWYDLIIGIVLCLSALLGDLWESSLKRQYGVKDSGKALPGHGGILDRFDSSLLAIVLYNSIIIQNNAAIRKY